jgi:hypothetical protein
MNPVRREILRLSVMIADAERRKDADAVAPHIAEDYVGIDPSGQLIDKAMLIERYRSGSFHLDKLLLRETAVKANEYSAWESGVMDLAGSLGEKQFSGRYRYSHFWVRSEEAWRIAGSQMTPILA